MAQELTIKQPKSSLKNRLRSAKWHKEHPDRVNFLKKRWRDKNPGWHLNYVNKNRAAIYTRNRARWDATRNEIFELLGNKCCWPGCKWNDKRALQIDHINGGGRQAQKMFKSLESYYKNILEEIKSGSKDYQLLCANHNWIKRCDKHEFAHVKLIPND